MLQKLKLNEIYELKTLHINYIWQDNSRLRYTWWKFSSTLCSSFCCTLYDRRSITAIMVIAIFYQNFVYGKKDFRIDVRVLQVAVVNGHTAVEKELRKFLKVRKANCNTGVDYLNYSSKTTHFGVWGIEFWLRSEIGYELWGVPPGETLATFQMSTRSTFLS